MKSLKRLMGFACLICLGLLIASLMSPHNAYSTVLSLVIGLATGVFYALWRIERRNERDWKKHMAAQEKGLAKMREAQAAAERAKRPGFDILNQEWPEDASRAPRSTERAERILDKAGTKPPRYSRHASQAHRDAEQEEDLLRRRRRATDEEIVPGVTILSPAFDPSLDPTPAHSSHAAHDAYSGHGGEFGGAGASGSWDSGSSSDSSSSSDSGGSSGGDSGGSSSGGSD